MKKVIQVCLVCGLIYECVIDGIVFNCKKDCNHQCTDGNFSSGIEHGLCNDCKEDFDVWAEQL